MRLLKLSIVSQWEASLEDVELAGSLPSHGTQVLALGGCVHMVGV